MRLIKRYKSMLRRIADTFRCNDAYFEDLDIEQRTLLNDAGKILGYIWSELTVYDHADDEKRIEIRRRMNTLRHKIEQFEGKEADEK